MIKYQAYSFDLLVDSGVKFEFNIYDCLKQLLENEKDVACENLKSYLQKEWYEIPEGIISSNINPITGELDSNGYTCYYIKGSEPNFINFLYTIRSFSFISNSQYDVF